MRRTIVLAAIAAIAACGLGATPAAVAATSRATPLGASAAPVVVFGSGQGTRCMTVESKIPLRIGAVCVTVFEQGPVWRAEVTFLSESGKLRDVSVKNLKLQVAGVVKERTGRVLKTDTGKRGLIPSNWWEPDISGLYGRAGVYNACIDWAAGGRACTGPYWFYTLRVRF
jgi:hypothetical protein